MLLLLGGRSQLAGRIDATHMMMVRVMRMMVGVMMVHESGMRTCRAGRGGSGHGCGRVWVMMMGNGRGSRCSMMMMRYRMMMMRMMRMHGPMKRVMYLCVMMAGGHHGLKRM